MIMFWSCLGEFNFAHENQAHFNGHRNHRDNGDGLFQLDWDPS